MELIAFNSLVAEKSCYGQIHTHIHIYTHILSFIYLRFIQSSNPMKGVGVCSYLKMSHLVPNARVGVGSKKSKPHSSSRSGGWVWKRISRKCSLTEYRIFLLVVGLPTRVILRCCTVFTFVFTRKILLGMVLRGWVSVII